MTQSVVSVIAFFWMLDGTVRADAVDDAKRHYERGTVAYALGHYSMAADEYEQAFTLKPDPALLYNAALARRLQGDARRSLLLFRSYVSTPLFAQRPQLPRVLRYIDELQQVIADEEATRRKDAVPTAWSRPKESAATNAVAASPELMRGWTRLAGWCKEHPTQRSGGLAALALLALTGGLMASRRKEKPAVPLAPPIPRKTLVLD